MYDRREDAKRYCPYFRGVDGCTCALLAAMSKSENVRCKVWRGAESIRCRYLDTQICRR